MTTPDQQARELAKLDALINYWMEQKRNIQAELAKLDTKHMKATAMLAKLGKKRSEIATFELL